MVSHDATDAGWAADISMSIGQLLSAKGCFVPTISPQARIADVIRVLEVENVGALVVTADGNEIDGLISERDVVRGLQWYGPEVLRHCVRDLMTQDVAVCSVHDSVSMVLSLMGDRMIRHVPVVEEGALAGIIGMLDILRFQLDTKDQAPDP